MINQTHPLFLSILFTLSYIASSISAGQAQPIEKWDFIEIEMQADVEGNPFTNVNLNATFQYKNREYFVEGFYDRDNTYKIRFMPDEEGEWSYRTSSNVKKLDDKTGTFQCIANRSGNHGPVKVRDTYHFGYADGTPFYPLGTTAYAWVHQPDNLKHKTLETLKQQSFNKVRMTVMPKQFSTYIRNEPPHYPFEGSKAEGWDFNKFNVEFFQHFEKYVDSLRQLNIEADIILFHPYDYGKWDFDQMSEENNIRYLRYFIARMAAYRNVWWSMANEYDMMRKPHEEWVTYFKTVTTHDPSDHLLSIHNGKAWYDHSEPWITHLSVQTPYLQDIQDWRETYEKPVINDEPVYEGNIPHNWGNLTPEELVNRFWICYTRGAYASHGETYEHPENVLWWSKGGKLYGESAERLTFLLEIMKDAPVEGLTPFHNDWNKDTYLYKGESFYLYYFGNSQQVSAILNLPEDKAYEIEVIDAWNMTINKLEGNYSGKTQIPLPEAPYMAVRVHVIKE